MITKECSQLKIVKIKYIILDSDNTTNIISVFSNSLLVLLDL